MIGAVLENYRILRKLGEGGMGEVYEAEHVGLGKRVAIKVLRPECASNPEILQRFYNEARAVAVIAHEAIVDIQHFGKQASGAPFFAMELLAGESLSARLRRDGKLAPEVVVVLGWLLCDPLAAAHARGIVHRDLKPDNVFLVPERLSPIGVKVKVLDFGIAKLLDERSDVQTGTSSMMGTPAYMSPEQCRGSGRVDQRSDVYALGCILYEAVTGRRPFVEAGRGELISAHLHLMPRRPGQVEPSVPPALEAIVMRALAKDPARRFASMSEMGGALDSLRRAGPVSSWPEVIGSVPEVLRTPPPGATWPPDAPPRVATTTSRRRLLARALAGTSFATAVLVTLVVLGRSARTDAATGPSAVPPSPPAVHVVTSPAVVPTPGPRPLLEPSVVPEEARPAPAKPLRRSPRKRAPAPAPANPPPLDPDRILGL